MYRNNHHTYRVWYYLWFQASTGELGTYLLGDDCTHRSRRIHNTPEGPPARYWGVGGGWREWERHSDRQR